MRTENSFLNAVNVLLTVLGLFLIAFLAVFVMDLIKRKDEKEHTNFLISGTIGMIANFFDTLGIGSFAIATSLLRFFKQIEDRVLPGTLNVGCCIPVMTEAFLFISRIEVEPITLVSMLSSATAGAYLGAGIVSKLPTKTVQRVMAFALAVTGTIVVLQLTGILPTANEESVVIGLSGAKLFIGIFVNFILGALMTAGIGLYAPCLALVIFLGMNTRAAFPIMMASCAFLMPVASIKFVKEGAYNKKASLAIAMLGVPGVLIAYKFFEGLSLYMLKWLVVTVMIYTSITLLAASRKNQETA
ncbi:MAG: sulfite exporter TauE/SafE family protein [Peptostreptococcaceae bacterium]|nr:sulfite exporter TauE/SafE family protein [Peptostreptococcaceae bacterium]